MDYGEGVADRPGERSEGGECQSTYQRMRGSSSTLGLFFVDKMSCQSSAVAVSLEICQAKSMLSVASFQKWYDPSRSMASDGDGYVGV